LSSKELIVKVQNNIPFPMKYFWDSLKVSFTGARLSHLVQKDKIWDHGSMTEYTRIIFNMVQKAKSNKNVESLQKQCTVSCFNKLKKELDQKQNHLSELIKYPVIKELAFVCARPGKKRKHDKFTALITSVGDNDHVSKSILTGHWSFVRQGEWWLLDKIR